MLQDPFAILSLVSIPLGAHVADFGSGSGAYAIAASRIVGENGTVYAVEVQKDIVTRLENDLQHKNIHNVHAVWGDIETGGGSRLRDNSIDWVILANVLFQAPDRHAVLLEAKRVLKPGGVVLIVDWKESFNNMGPATKDIIPETESKRILDHAGFGTIESKDVGVYQYALIGHKTV